MKAFVEWDGYYWVATPEVASRTNGGATQAKRLDQLPELIVDLVAVMTGQVITPDEVKLIVKHPGARQATTVRKARQRLDRDEHALAARARAVVADLRARGMSMRDIAWMVGMSYQRVHQLTAMEKSPRSRRSRHRTRARRKYAEAKA